MHVLVQELPGEPVFPRFFSSTSCSTVLQQLSIIRDLPAAATFADFRRA